MGMGGGGSSNGGIEELNTTPQTMSLTSSLRDLQLPSLSMPSTLDLQNSAADSFQQLVQQSTYPTTYTNLYNNNNATECDPTPAPAPHPSSIVHHQLINHHLQQQPLIRPGGNGTNTLMYQPLPLQHQQHQQHQQQSIYNPVQHQQHQQQQQSIYNPAQQHQLQQQQQQQQTSTTTTTTNNNTTTLPVFIPSTTQLQTTGNNNNTLHNYGQSLLAGGTQQQPQQHQTQFTDLLSDEQQASQPSYIVGNQIIKQSPYAFINPSLLPLSQNHTQVIVGDVDITIEQQPPSDVRTRTPNDRRTFNCVIRVVGDFAKNNITNVLAQLAYANTYTERPSQDILGGNKVVPVGKDGKAVFDSLSMTEASTKHQENEFCLEYILLTDDNKRFILSTGQPFLKRSRPFYAYSNQKVLSRRRNVTLRTLSSNKGSSLGGDQMHVVGSPFIRCNSLRCIFHTAHGDIPANNIELFSESVLFFTLPPYPAPPNFCPPDGTELAVQVVTTNDGRNYSNPLPFTYIFENGGAKRLRSRF
ncbi:hypothetical protein SAMD00019534_101350 [Acytostelium subglobosum LB1]|uniref:hypothetical protein n=1 Tax=Acytostelium subglobosum LB1 TaxID=1410327 RepID=UPI000644D875|nr:hypothetical protein SAMD00019534_101350 [Acytostelium subglobosum LB1]GAM26960.1 hypothetical protein SAMD00019534_101350 [Acytostelium subglobosum LB1]|eukprot:XP_012750228.1 hypothetical protein SAMD00019534_101350 [Acytostelium subglobosum LB1]